MKPIVLLWAGFIVLWGEVHAAVLAPPTYRYTFAGTLDSTFLHYPAGTPVGFDIVGDATTFTGSPPTSVPDNRTSYWGFAGSFWIGTDSVALEWEIRILNDWIDSVTPGPTIDSFTFLGESAPGDYHFFFLDLHDESARALFSTNLPVLDQVEQFYAEINYNLPTSLDSASITPLSLSTTIVPEPELPATLGASVLLMARIRRRFHLP